MYHQHRHPGYTDVFSRTRAVARSRESTPVQPSLGRETPPAGAALLQSYSDFCRCKGLSNGHNAEHARRQRARTMRRVVRALLGGPASDGDDAAGEDADGDQEATYETDTDGSSYSFDVPASELAAATARAADGRPAASANKEETSGAGSGSEKRDGEAAPGCEAAGAGIAGAAAASGRRAQTLRGDGEAGAAASAGEDTRDAQHSTDLRTSLFAANVLITAQGSDARQLAPGGNRVSNAGTAAPPPTPARTRYDLRSRKSVAAVRPPPVQSADAIAPVSDEGVALASPEAHEATAPGTGPVLVPSYTSLRPRQLPADPEGGAAAGHGAVRGDVVDDVNSHVVKYQAIDSRVKEVDDASLQSLRAICHRMGVPINGSKDVLRTRARTAALGRVAGTQQAGGDISNAFNGAETDGTGRGIQPENVHVPPVSGHGAHAGRVGDADAGGEGIPATFSRPHNVREYEGEVVQPAPTPSGVVRSPKRGIGADGYLATATEAVDGADADRKDEGHHLEQSSMRTTTTRVKHPSGPTNALTYGNPAFAPDGMDNLSGEIAEGTRNAVAKYATPKANRKAQGTASPHGITHLSTPGPENDPTNTSTADASGGHGRPHGGDDVRRSTVKIPVMPRFIEDPSRQAPLPDTPDHASPGVAAAELAPGLAPQVASQAAAGGLCESVDAQFHAASRNGLDGTQDQTSAAFYGVQGIQNEAKPGPHSGTPAAPPDVPAGGTPRVPPSSKPVTNASPAFRVSPSKDANVLPAVGERGTKLTPEKFETPQRRMQPNVSGNLVRSVSLTEAGRKAPRGVGRPVFEAPDGGSALNPPETFLPPPPPTPADSSAARKRNSNVMTSLQALGKRGFGTMNSAAALAGSCADNAFEGERVTRQISPSRSAKAGLAYDKDAAHARVKDSRQESELFRPPPEKKRRMDGDANKLRSGRLTASHDWPRVPGSFPPQSGGLVGVNEKPARPGAAVDPSKALFVPGSGTLASAAASAALSATVAANAAAAAAAAAGSMASLVENAGGSQSHGAAAIVKTGGLPPRPPMPSPRAGQRTAATPQLTAGNGGALPATYLPGAKLTYGDRLTGGNANRHLPLPAFDTAVKNGGSEDGNVNEVTSSVRESPLPRPVASRMSADAGFVTPRDIIRTLQNKSTARPTSAFRFRASADQGISTPGTATREDARAIPGSAFASVSRGLRTDFGGNDGAEGFKSMTPYETTKRFSGHRTRSDRASLELSLRRRRAGSASSALVTDLRPGASTTARPSAPSELRVNALRVESVHDGVLGVNRPVAVSASAKKILASLDKVSRENRASATKRIRSPLGRPPSSKRQRRSDSSSIVPGGDDEVIGGSKWFLNTIKAHAAAASSQLPRDAQPLDRKSILAKRRKRPAIGGRSGVVEAEDISTVRLDSENSPLGRLPVSSSRPLSRTDGGISKKRKQQRQNLGTADARTPSAFTSYMAKEYKASLVSAGDPEEVVNTPFSFGAPLSNANVPKSDFGAVTNGTLAEVDGDQLAKGGRKAPTGSDAGGKIPSSGNKTTSALAKSLASPAVPAPVVSENTLPAPRFGVEAPTSNLSPSADVALGGPVMSSGLGDISTATECGRDAVSGANENGFSQIFGQKPAGSDSPAAFKQIRDEMALPFENTEGVAEKPPTDTETKERLSVKAPTKAAVPQFSFAAASSSPASMPASSGFPVTAPATRDRSEPASISPSHSAAAGGFGFPSTNPVGVEDAAKMAPTTNDKSSPEEKATGSFDAAFFPEKVLASSGKDTSVPAPSSGFPFSFQIPPTKPGTFPTSFGSGPSATPLVNSASPSRAPPFTGAARSSAPDASKIGIGKDAENTVAEEEKTHEATAEGGESIKLQKDSAADADVVATDAKTELEPKESKLNASVTEKDEPATALPSKADTNLFSGMKPLTSPGNVSGSGLFSFGSTVDKTNETKPTSFSAGPLAQPETTTPSAALFSFGSGAATFGANTGSKPALQVPENGQTKAAFPAPGLGVPLASSGSAIPASSPFSAAASQSAALFSFGNAPSASAPMTSNASSPSLFSAPASMMPSATVGTNANASGSGSGFTGSQFGVPPSNQSTESALHSASSSAAPASAPPFAAFAPIAPMSSTGLSFNPPASGTPALQPPAPGGNPFAKSSLPPPSTSAAPAMVHFGGSSAAATPFASFPQPNSSPSMVFGASVPSAVQPPAAPSFGAPASNPGAPFAFGAGAGAGMGAAAGPSPFGVPAPGISPFGAPAAVPPANALAVPSVFNAPPGNPNMFAPAQPGMPGIGSGVDPGPGSSGFNMGRSTAPPTNARRKLFRGRRHQPR